MSQEFDVVVLGGGIVGAAMALSLAESSLSVALVDGDSLNPAAQPLADAQFDPRVCALTEASANIFDYLGVWQNIVARRACPYTDMDVWDAEGTGSIAFSADDMGEPHLGHIVENSVIRDALLTALQSSAIHLLPDTEVKGMVPDDAGVTLRLADDSELKSRLLVAADGASSRARFWAGIPMREWDYLHHAVVTTVETEQPHQSCARQNFLNTGPLAFLPLPDSADGRHFCSVVWSQVPDEASRVMALSDNAFCEELGKGIEHKLGRVIATDKRHCLPLRQRHARQYHRNRVVLIGDAAHTIHPLAGQGANLGLLDMACLAEEILHAHKRGGDIASQALLNRYQRRREGQNLAMAAVMEGFQHLFNSDNLLLRWVRNTGLRAADGLPFLKQSLVSRAMGLKGDFPAMADKRA